MISHQKIAIIGAGAWGSALASIAVNAGNDVLLWGKEPNVIDTINQSHTTPYLPDTVLPHTLNATLDMALALQNADFAFLVVPAQATREVYAKMMPLLDEKTVVVLCAKGIELKTGQLLSEVVHELNPTQQLAVLSGPGFAREVVMQRPTAITIAAPDKQTAITLSTALKTDYFRPYSSTDFIAPQVCGAIKNVLAIASGISDGCGFGDNAKAALLTRGLAEMARFATSLGANRESVLGLSGIGDLILTANSTQSRNYAFGYAIGQCDCAKEVLANSTKTVEGVATAQSVLKRAAILGVELPICQVVSAIIYQEKPIKTALLDLLNRPLKSEE